MAKKSTTVRTSLPYLGQRVLFNDPYLVQSPGARTPRFALVSGLGERPGIVHLTVFNHPDDDCHAQGMAPIQARRRVDYVARGEPLPGPTVCYCTPADDLVPAGAGDTIPLPKLKPRGGGRAA